MTRPLSMLALAAVLVAPSAHAESQASSTGKGTVGVALLGAEAVTITEAALGVRPGWAYIVGGLAGAAGGGVGGYFLEDGSPRLNMYLLAAGMALVIPTTVAVLSATAYQPPADYTEDRGPIDQPVDEPPESEGDFDDALGETSRRTSPHKTRHSIAMTTGLLGYRDELTFGLPAISIGNVYTQREVLMFGVDPETEVQLSLFDARF